ncbi:MAG: hypothetical protein K2H38_12485 [Muribaculaceae bacterium]|nr:hypothetical protein [Muribaculaceae bacterium]MDE6551760.1 hypothetical protein [Muribaculaceae bacterium]
MSNLKLQKIDISAAVINGCIADMLNNAGREGTCPAEEGLTSIREESKLNQDTGYSTQFDIINSAYQLFSTNGLQKVDIARRLALIDLFYTTNLNRFAEFGLAELTERIWNLCVDSMGNHTDSELVKKVEDFVKECSLNPNTAYQNPIYQNLFSPTAKFGITDVKEENGSAVPQKHGAESLISKYFFFLLENHHTPENVLGFPIFDRIAYELQGPLLKKLNMASRRQKDMVCYVRNMTSILDCLVNSPDPNSRIWKMPTIVCNTQFGLLDYFLWRIGKSGKFSFSLLWSKAEKIAHYPAASRLADKNQPSTATDFYSLPQRFQDWHIIYISI